MLDFREVVDLLGLEYEDRGGALMMVCPLPDHADTVASFKVWVDEGRYYCFGCESRGDAGDLYSAVRGMDKEAALEEIERLTGAPVAIRRPVARGPGDVARGRGEKALAPLRGKLPAAEHAALGERLDKICWAYRKRKITVEQLEPALDRFLRELPVVP